MRKRFIIFAAATLIVAAVVPIAMAIESNVQSIEGDLGFIGGVMQLVQRFYVRPIDANRLTEEALKGMLSRLDPHSEYMNENEFRQTTADVSGKFGGLGIEITKQNGLPEVISPIDDTPAAHAGLEPGDLIVSINGESTVGTDLEDIVNKIRGEPGTSLTLTISRDGKTPFEVHLVRDVIRIQSVKSKSEPDNVGYIRISRFDSDTPADFKKAISTLKQTAGGRLRGLVLDLRDDPGGLLTAAVGVAGSLLTGGTVVSIRGREASEDQTFTAPTNGEVLPSVPIVVLINGASASASEIVAGALQDRHRATVMGTTSFGKGSVQTLIPLKGHGALRLTTALYYTPAGRAVQDNGIVPDVVVEVPKDEQADTSTLLHESELHGALANPAKESKNSAPTPASSALYSHPIKAELIATAQDSQLKAALAYLGQRKGASDSD
jgi:carboxyl-terminal processing protease